MGNGIELEWYCDNGEDVSVPSRVSDVRWVVIATTFIFTVVGAFVVKWLLY